MYRLAFLIGLAYQPYKHFPFTGQTAFHMGQLMLSVALTCW